MSYHVSIVHQDGRKEQIKCEDMMQAFRVQRKYVGKKGIDSAQVIYNQ